MVQFLTVTVLPFDSLNNNTAECKVRNSFIFTGRLIYIHCFPQVTTNHLLPNDIDNLKIIKFIQQKNLSIKKSSKVRNSPFH